MNSGHEAIKQLLLEFDERDPKASSHWEKFHRFLKINSHDEIEARGFGGNARPYRGLRKVGHRVMQRKFRGMGEGELFVKYDKVAEDIAGNQVRAYDLDMIRQALTASFVQSKFSGHIPDSPVVGIVGDGFGTLASLLLMGGFTSKVILVNLTRTLVVDLIYLLKANPEFGIVLPESKEEFRDDAARHANIIAIRAKDACWMREIELDVIFNVASMQEMDPEVIAEYFSEFRRIAQRRKIFFYCCNRERKELPDGTVTKFRDYPWSPKDNIFLDELCPWHQEYYSVFPPNYHAYDGPIRHRFVGLSSVGK